MPATSSPEFEYHHFNQLPAKVQQLLKDRVQKAGNFASLQTLHLTDNLRTYRKQSKTILCPGNLEIVWEVYTNRQPFQTWQGPLVNFLFSYSPQLHQFFYLDDPEMPPVLEGMQCYCLLDLWGPRLIIGLKILRIDKKDKILEIAYIEGGLYRGTQILTFSPQDSQTKIEHLSYYKSQSRLMDRTLYPFFHNWTVGEHHAKMAKEAEAIKSL